MFSSCLSYEEAAKIIYGRELRQLKNGMAASISASAYRNHHIGNYISEEEKCRM
jgi:hypothetical protein